MHFHQEQLAEVEFLLWMALQERQQTLHELRDDLRVIVQLDADDSQIPGRWVAHDVRKIAI